MNELFRNSGRPQFEIKAPDGTVVGKLLGTMAFVGPGMAVRVIEVEGPLPVVAAHISRQPAVQEFERQLTDLISVPRDMGTPDGAREFFARASMECVLSRRHDQPEQSV